MLKELSELNGVSGDESKVREFIRSKIGKYAADLMEDAYGNLIVRIGKAKKPSVMLAAHMDEVGLMITGVEKTGLLRFRAIGMMTNVLLAKRVLIGKDSVLGVVGHKPIHLAEDDDLKKMPKMKDLFIDIGASSKEDASKIVEIGDYATFDTKFGENGGIIRGKAFDNRIGCFIMLQLIEQSELPMYCVFTVQEEVGLRGARIAAHRLKPSVALAIDTTSSGEWPEERDLPQYPAIGAGPAITIADRSVICDAKVVKVLRETAEREKIPYQMKRPMVGGTDAGTMHLAEAGVRAGVVSIPARYIHSPLAFASKKDISATTDLVRCGIESICRKEKEWD
ncbi:MAG: M20/M25/M40 family metallo-hydrolase [candidate division WOR-3 bacterium]|nr:MAG: M20/M25/M40 family metallo-hydrolase [candidate division WOR-3 bacterium]